MKQLQQVFRRLGRAPMFTTMALLSLALGIGANTAVFSVVNGVLLKPLPYPQAEQLVGVWHVAPGLTTGNIQSSPTMSFTYRQENQTFQDIGLWSSGGASVTGEGDPEQAQALFVTFGTLQALGVQPAMGRWFSQADDSAGAPETAILTYGYWQRRFGGDTSIMDRSLTVDSRTRRVIGVMPQSFRFLNANPDLILPLRLDRNRIFLSNFSYQALARLKPGVTLQQANADVGRMLPIWLRSWPPPPGVDRSVFENARFAPNVQPLKQEVVGDVGTILWVLMGTIGLVLLIACANFANLLLVRAEARQQEMAIRVALGAGWVQIARAMLLESLSLGILGGGLGLGLAWVALRILVTRGPATLPRLSEIGIDSLVLAFTIAVSLLAGLVFGLIPVVKYLRPDMASALRSGGRSISQSRERHRTRNALVIVQVALALVLLICSVLMLRTFQALQNVQPGFTRPEEVQMLRIPIPAAQVRDPEQVVRTQIAIVEKLAAIPGVTSAGFANSAPLENINVNDVLYAEDKNYSAGQIPPVRRFRFVSPGFFQTTGTRLIAGRDFTWTDLTEKRQVAIVSENLAREMWGGPLASLGKRIRASISDPWREVVGVAGDVYDNGMQEKPQAFAYWPALTDTFWGDPVHITRNNTFVIRTSRARTESLLTEVRQAVWSVNANLPLFQVRTLKDVYDLSLARTSFTLVMLAIAGAMALVLGIVGIYGVIAYAVSQRTREIGIRMALGADPAQVQGLFVRQGLVLAGIGSALGLLAAAGLTRLLSSLLFGVTAIDPLTFAGVSVVLIAAAALASYLPARRATAVDPVRALRAD